jgi:peptidoglycan/LPS O-acetylase OafA/YrhL
MMTQLYDVREILVREAVPSSDTVRERFATIDGLRAIAIMAVIVYEAFAHIPGLAGGRPALARAFDELSQGVTLFFVLSGFALAYPAVVAFTESGRAYLDIARYVIKRALRIYPAYLLALLLAFAIPPLAQRYGLPEFGVGAKPIAIDDVVRSIFFVGDGLGNDGFRAVAIVARLYLFFPFLLLLWSRSWQLFAALGAAFAILDATTGLHALGIGAFVPFMLGMVAARIRAEHLPAYRFGIPLALIAGIAAILWGPSIAHAAAIHAPKGTLRIDPLWSLAFFGVLVAMNAVGPMERICSFAPLRLLGSASYAISLAVVPATAFAARQLVPSFGSYIAAGNAIVASILVGFVLWQLVDRSFTDDKLRRDAADLVGPVFARVLARVRADRVVLGKAPEAVMPDLEPAFSRVEPSFYTPAPRPDARDLAVVSQRTGSPAELAEEILATKKRLQDRSAAFFDGPKPVEAPVEYKKPGFYRKPASKVLGTTLESKDVTRALPVESNVGAESVPTHPSPAETTMPMINTLPPTSPERTPIKVRIGAPHVVLAEAAIGGQRVDG